MYPIMLVHFRQYVFMILLHYWYLILNLCANYNTSARRDVSESDLIWPTSEKQKCSQFLILKNMVQLKHVPSLFFFITQPRLRNEYISYHFSLRISRRQSHKFQLIYLITQMQIYNYCNISEFSKTYEMTSLKKYPLYC